MCHRKPLLAFAFLWYNWGELAAGMGIGGNTVLHVDNVKAFSFILFLCSLSDVTDACDAEK